MNPKLQGFLEQETLGNGVYDAYVEDCDLSNPFCSSLWEFLLLEVFNFYIETL